MKKPKLKLLGEDGNAYAILARAQRAWQKADLPAEDWEDIKNNATSGDYDTLLRVIMENFDCMDVDENDED